MEKSNTKEFLKVAIITFIISILLLFALLTLQINGIFVQIGTPPNGISHQAIRNLLIIVAIVSLIYLFNDRGIKGIIIAIGVFFIIVPSLPNLLTEAEYTRFSSPDNKEEFVVIERGYGRLYQLSNSRLYMTYLTSINTDDGYKPFSDSAYKLEWEEPNQLIIYFKFDYMSDSLSKEISTKYRVK
ncbi:hypothetical protein LIS77_24225 [Cytobacillus firmus]|uniref:Uncharacterized protein n=1 Tax=Cytobacillus firmus TaxID=1399 RepID=A0AA46PM88_CYTFI|nr:MULTISPECIES: hypothetical protein [Bacillaceae]KML42153.1 hypothetical protein VL14_09325 [Cytobacillus firmus]MBY6053652.1 hypothetical protein [Cytobacillus firmus]PAE23390.1 hypothetical protein CHI10_18275 [Bacillus sp. 7894-2]USK38945.1 hypothetical protein LIS77_24225 [Cytobacillus firmus]UYG93555.1 hypothetical protein OD459_15210 [Cytobacillus firmus]